MAKVDRMSGKDFQEKHRRELVGALEDISSGVDAVTSSPGKDAAASKDVWVKKLAMKAVQDKWETNVGGYSLEDWKTDMKELAVSRIPSGLDRKAGKIQAFGDALLAYEKPKVAEFKKRKPVLLEESVSKASDWIRTMAKFHWKK